MNGLVIEKVPEKKRGGRISHFAMHMEAARKCKPGMGVLLANGSVKNAVRAYGTVGNYLRTRNITDLRVALRGDRSYVTKA